MGKKSVVDNVFMWAVEVAVAAMCGALVAVFIYGCITVPEPTPVVECPICVDPQAVMKGAPRILLPSGNRGIGATILRFPS